MIKRFLAGFLLFLTLLFCGCQTTLGNTGTDTTDNPGETENNVQPVVSIASIIEDATFQYPSMNDDFYYEVYDDYVAITQYIGGPKEHVIVPDTIEERPVYKIAASAFKKAEIQSVDISKNVYSIENEAFDKCKLLQSVTFTDVTVRVNGAPTGTGVVKIGESAFNSCIALTDIVLPDGLETIKGNAFYGCESLKEINLPDSVTSLGSSLFYECISLEQLTIPHLVTYIPAAFCVNCTSLTDVYIGATVTEIASSAFNSVPTTVTFHSTPTSVAAEYASAHFFRFEVTKSTRPHSHKNKPWENLVKE